MTGVELINMLGKHDTRLEVLLNDIRGCSPLTVNEVSYKENEETKSVLVIETENDFDVREELQTRFNNAAEKQLDEYDFFSDLIEDGYTMPILEKYLPEQYEYVYNFCSDHGII